MKDLRKLFFYLLAIVLLGALLAPPLFWGAHLLAAQSGNATIADFVAKTDFQRFFNRAILVAAIILLIPLLRTIRIPDREALGLETDTAPWSHFLAGFAIAFLSMAAMAGLALWIGPYTLRNNLHFERMVWLPVTAITVAVIEEYLFRGVIQGIAQRTLTNWMAIFFVSGLFAIVHFLKPPETGIAVADVYWYSGLDLLTQAFWQFGKPKLLLGGVSTLFLVGAVLGYARLRTRSLWMPIGLHAGWVLSKMSFSIMTRRSGESWPWFGGDILIGLVPVITLLATGTAVWWWLNHVDKNRYRRWG